MTRSNLIGNGAYALRAQTGSDLITTINANNNWWGVSDSAAIEEMVFHNSDDASCPVISFMPFAEEYIPIPDTNSTAVIEPLAGTLPTEISLRQNYPNPFNASTLIEFDLARSAQVDLSVYDLLGRQVRQLISTTLTYGSYQAYFDGTDDRGGDLASGVYFYRLRTDTAVLSRKLLLLK